MMCPIELVLHDVPIELVLHGLTSFGSNPTSVKAQNYAETWNLPRAV